MVDGCTEIPRQARNDGGRRWLDSAAEGQALVEYGLVIIIVLTGAMAGLLAFQDSVDILWVLVNTLQDTFS